MYAIIEQGGKQHKVAEGDRIRIDLTKVKPEDKTISFDRVLLVSDGKKVKIGTPLVEGAKVSASFDKTAAEAVVKGKKLYPTSLRRRKNSRRRIGHRQKYLEVVIDKIKA
jgi:large subunit ribosomal protein L21